MRHSHKEFCPYGVGVNQILVDFFELGRFSLKLLYEKGVFQDDRCLISDRLYQDELLLRERGIVFLVIDVQDAQQFALAQDRAGDERGSVFISVTMTDDRLTATVPAIPSPNFVL
jgi:hypothetical protein